LQEALMDLNASAAMTREFRVVDAEMTITQFSERYLSKDDSLTVYFASSGGRYRGMVVPDEIQVIERSEWDTSSIHRVIKPLADIPTVDEADRLRDVIDRMETKELRSITVLSPAGAVAGIIDRGDIVRAIAQKLKVTIPESLIKRIKDEGAYPPGLPLHELAKASL
jgi:predicted transcriptional regulator